MTKIDFLEMQEAFEIFKTPLKKKKRVMLIRHGQSEGNVSNIYYGSTDYPLTKIGIFQAQLLSEALKAYLPLFNGIKCSNLIRALETCKGCVDLEANHIISDFKKQTVETTCRSWSTYSETKDKENDAILNGNYIKSENYNRISYNKIPSEEKIKEMKSEGLENYIKLQDFSEPEEVR